MPEQTAAALARYIAPLAAFASALLMLLFKREMEPRRMVIAMAGGPFFAFLMTPSAVALLLHAYPQLPNDLSLVGFVAAVIGMLPMSILKTVSIVGGRVEGVAKHMALPDNKGDRDAH